jgi:hypothetical protein
MPWFPSGFDRPTGAAETLVVLIAVSDVGAYEGRNRLV